MVIFREFLARENIILCGCRCGCCPLPICINCCCCCCVCWLYHLCVCACSCPRAKFNFFSFFFYFCVRLFYFIFLRLKLQLGCVIPNGRFYLPEGTIIITTTVSKQHKLTKTQKTHSHKLSVFFFFIWKKIFQKKLSSIFF